MGDVFSLKWGIFLKLIVLCEVSIFKPDEFLKKHFSAILWLAFIVKNWKNLIREYQLLYFMKKYEIMLRKLNTDQKKNSNYQ